MGLPTGTVTFLLTDVEDSTRAWQRDEAAMRSAMARHEAILDAAVTAHRGLRPREQGEGDSVVAVFERAADAVAAAVDAQLALADTPLKVRMGVHTGDAEADDATASYAGPTVIRAARVRSLAHGGQILLSRTTADTVADALSPDLTLLDLGTHRLKGLDRPEHIFQVAHRSLRRYFPPLSAARSPTNLPVELTSFVGRERELAELSALLAQTRILTLTGAGGCGKTRLAARAAAAAADDLFPDGVWWVELGPLNDAGAVDQAVASAVGAPEQSGQTLLDVVTDRLATRRALVVLDNCEHLLDHSALWSSSLVSRCPEVSVLATSREALGVAGEVAWRVPSLTLPEGGDARCDAVRLFEDRACLGRPGFGVGSDNVDAVAEICRRVDGMPLAIELAAARVRMLSPAQIAAGLNDRFRLLAGGTRSAVRRQQTLRASVEWSVELLSADELTVLRRLAVFVGGFSLEAAEAVCAGDGVEPFAVFELLARLVDKSLVNVDEAVGDARYRLLETIRQYAVERLGESGEIEAARDRHLAYYAAFAEHDRGLDGEHAAWMTKVGLDHDNLEAALEWALSADDVGPAVALAVALAPYWLLRGHLRRGRDWATRVLERTQPDDTHRGWALWLHAALGGYGGSIETIQTTCPEALAIARARDDSSLAARCLNLQALAQTWSDPAAARRLLDEAEPLARAADDGYALGEALLFAGWSWVMQDDRTGELDVSARLRAVADDRHDPELEAMAEVIAVFASVRGGDLAEARAALARARGVPTELNPLYDVYVAVAAADVELLSGDLHGARRQLEESLQLVKRSGAGSATTSVATQLAFVHLAEGDTAGARALAEKYLVPSRAQGATFAVLLCLLTEGAALLLEGELPGSAAALDEALGIARDYGNRWMGGMAAQFRGYVAYFGGDHAAAETFHHEALALRVEGGYLPAIIESLEDLAGVALAGGRADTAARLLAAAESARRAFGYGRRSGAEPLHAYAVEACRAALGDDAFEQVWQDGEKLSLEDAVSFATRARGRRKRPATGWSSLTPTERTVVEAVEEGLANPEIARRLFMSLSTVKTHLEHVFTKLGVTSRSELAAMAARVASQQPPAPRRDLGQ